jgi:hypothetical protein
MNRNMGKASEARKVDQICLQPIAGRFNRHDHEGEDGKVERSIHAFFRLRSRSMERVVHYSPLIWAENDVDKSSNLKGHIWSDVSAGNSAEKCKRTVKQKIAGALGESVRLRW